MLAAFFGNEYSVWAIMRQYWLIFPAAFVVALIATPLCRKLALRLGVVDMPDNEVKTHATPTAYLGGLGMLAGMIVGLAIGFWILYKNQSHVHVLDVPKGATDFPSGTAISNWPILAGIAIGAIIVCIVGILDDIFDIRPWQKFLGQAIAAAVLIGVGIRPDLSYLFSQFNVHLPPILDFLFGIPIVMFFILGASNSLNLLDGLDGLCAGVTSIITIAFLLLALSLATFGHSYVGDPVRLIVCLAMVGGTLGFLPLNRHPAKIFMGDAGSMLLGFLAGTLMILFTERIGRWSIGAIIIFGLPILDTAVALFRRFINKRPLFVSDRGHIYDQIMDRTHSLKKTLKYCYLLAILYALIGLTMTKFRFRFSVILFILVVVISSFFVWRAGFLQLPPKDTNDSND